MSNRIEYIDALRGFVMLLVVLGHVPMYCYHQTEGISFSLIPTTFHLALFFFISGWFVKNVKVKEKFMQLIVPTMVFYLIYCWLFDINIIENLWDDKYKSGYWFCIVLFCFFLIMKGLEQMNDLGGAILGIILSLCFLMLSTNAVTRLLAQWNIPNILCLQQWQYFVFFWVGNMARRYREQFFHLLDDGKVMAVGVLLFLSTLLLYYQKPMGLLVIKTSFLLWGGLGAILSFAFFSKYEIAFRQTTYIGRGLQYIGRRTLDVYLLHFFFLPRNLEGLGCLIMGNDNPTVELFVSLTIAMMVVALCLLTSNIIRLSPTLAHWVLGAK